MCPLRKICKAFSNFLYGCNIPHFSCNHMPFKSPIVYKIVFSKMKPIIVFFQTYRSMILYFRLECINEKYFDGIFYLFIQCGWKVTIIFISLEKILLKAEFSMTLPIEFCDLHQSFRQNILNRHILTDRMQILGKMQTCQGSQRTVCFINVNNLVLKLNVKILEKN